METEWIIYLNRVTGTLTVKESNEALTPVALIATPVGDWQKNERWAKRAFEKAHLVKAAPKMYNALLKVKEVMDLEAGKADMDNLYDVVKDALKEASYEIQETKLK